jgi:hypothetical protein
VYVEDLAEGVVRALAPPAADRTYNLGGTETVTIRQLAEIVGDVVGAGEIVHGPGRAGDLRGAEIDSSRAERELGWTATTPLRDGVRRYVDWLREQPEAAPAPLAAPAVPRPRLAAVLTAAMINPFVVGIVALVAVASAAISVIVGSTAEAQAADLTVLASSILLPLWALAVVPWPQAMRRTQAASAALFGFAGVVLLGATSAAPGSSNAHPARIGLVVVVSACITSALRIVPRRFARA